MFNVPGQRTNDTFLEPQFSLKLANLLEQKIKSDVQNLLTKSQTEFGADVLGVGDYLRTRYPQEWNQVRDNWREHYRTAKFELEVKATIIAPGTLSSHYPSVDPSNKPPSAE